MRFYRADGGTAADPVIEEILFQPFLRFYEGKPPGGGAPRRRGPVSTLLEILLLYGYA